MASIRRTGSGWQVRWRDQHGKQKGRTCPTKQAAQQLKREIEVCQALGTDWQPDRPGEQTTIQESLRAYITAQSLHLRPASVQMYARTLQVWEHFCEEQGIIVVGQLSKRLLREYWQWLELGMWDRPRRQKTKVRYVRTVQRWWQWAWDEEEETDHVPRPRKIKLPTTPNYITPVVATWAEMDAAISHCTHAGYQRAQIIMRYTGLRIAQALGLRWPDIDMHTGELHFRGELGKSAQERTGRVIPLSPHLIAEMAGWGRRTGYLVPDLHPRSSKPRQYTYKYGTQGWRDAEVREAVWSPQAGHRGQPNHAFRKGFHSELTLAGVNPAALDYYIGHAAPGQRGAYTGRSAYQLDELVAAIPPRDAGPRMRRIHVDSSQAM